VAALSNAGLTANGLSGNPTGTVTGTSPAVGSTVPTGSQVELFAK